MAQIFLSHSNDDITIAESVCVALRSAGYEVFFDKDDLPTGHTFDERIGRAIESADAFVFLATPNSLVPGRYTLTELEFARQRWRNPDGRIFPVIAGPIDFAALPAFLRGVTVLEPKGNIAAETVAAVNVRFGRPSVHYSTTLFAALGAVAAMVYFYFRAPLMDTPFLPLWFGLVAGLVPSYGVWRWEGRSLSKVALGLLVVLAVSIINLGWFHGFAKSLSRAIRELIELARTSGVGHSPETLQALQGMVSGVTIVLNGAASVAAVVIGLAVILPRFRRPGVWATAILVGAVSGIALEAFFKDVVLLALIVQWTAVGGIIGLGFARD